MISPTWPWLRRGVGFGGTETKTCLMFTLLSSPSLAIILLVVEKLYKTWRVCKRTFLNNGQQKPDVNVSLPTFPMGVSPLFFWAVISAYVKSQKVLLPFLLPLQTGNLTVLTQHKRTFRRGISLACCTSKCSSLTCCLTRGGTGLQQAMMPWGSLRKTREKQNKRTKFNRHWTKNKGWFLNLKWNPLT